MIKRKRAPGGNRGALVVGALAESRCKHQASPPSQQLQPLPRITVVMLRRRLWLVSLVDHGQSIWMRPGAMDNYKRFWRNVKAAVGIELPLLRDYEWLEVLATAVAQSMRQAAPRARRRP